VQLATEIRWQDRSFRIPLERIKLTEELGYDAAVTSEGWGSDGMTPLGYLAAVTTKLTLGTSITQVTARSPAATVMAMQTLNAMTGGGRVMLGLGSTRQWVAEGLHGRPWGNPVARMRDFVQIVRNGFEGRSLAHRGTELSVPYPAGANPVEPVRLLLDPTPDIPVYVAAGGKQMITLAGEIADGWLPRHFAPGMLAHAMPSLEEGFRRAGSGKSIENFGIWAHVDAMVDDDVRRAMQPFKEYVATWAGSQRQQMIWCGQGDVCDKIEELTAAGRRDEAVAAVPDDYIDHAWLVGPLSRIKQRLKPWLESGATGLIVRYGPQVGGHGPAENLDFFRVVAETARQ
jgi:alkanesulfonate monooxygenase SsuD/methylene tetrahydromethanopterin reductase-like flavin-dependent oxidoreductase (luciferase family)